MKWKGIVVMSKLMSFTGTALKNLFSSPVTTKYPEEPKEYPERTRGHVENDIDQCILCGMCMRKCPPGAIKVDRAKGTWSIERFDCIQCGYCTECCPKKCLKMVPGYQKPEETKHEETIEKPNMPMPAVAKKTAVADQSTKNQQNQQGDSKNHVAATLEKIDRPIPCNDDTCLFCTLCAKKCPAEAITVDRESKSWSVNEDKCLGCGVCAESCPKHSINLK